MVMRIKVEDLGDEVRESLERGERVEIERDGEVVASIPGERKKGGLRAFAEARRSAPPLDDKFEEDMAEILRYTNQPAAPLPWDS